MSNLDVKDNILSRIRLEHRARIDQAAALELRVSNLERIVGELCDQHP